MKTNLVRVSYYIVGILFLAFGISMTLLSDLGAGGWDALTDNLSKITDIKIGTILIFLGIFLVLIAGIISKGKPKVEALAVSFITGIFINIWYYDIFQAQHFENFYIRLFAVILGVLSISLGCAMMFTSNLPKNHTETFVFAITERFSFKYKTIKTIADTVALVIAILLGLIIKDFSNLGLGTILGTAFTGTLIHHMMPFTDGYFHKILKRIN